MYEMWTLSSRNYSLGREKEVCQAPETLGRFLEEMVLDWVLGEWTCEGGAGS